MEVSIVSGLRRGFFSYVYLFLRLFERVFVFFILTSCQYYVFRQNNAMAFFSTSNGALLCGFRCLEGFKANKIFYFVAFKKATTSRVCFLPRSYIIGTTYAISNVVKILDSTRLIINTNKAINYPRTRSKKREKSPRCL